ncbi:MAG TPA: Uma2 family endonuclease [Planctomycetaceae bacterium]|nr:Uma2 family endonuclease [Planctomycetaceae bacterium]
MSTVQLNAALPPPFRLHKFTVPQYHQLGELGILTTEDRVELLEGWIVAKMDRRAIHGFIVGFLTELIQNDLPDGFVVRSQLPMTTKRSEPEPDVAIVRGAHADFRTSHPTGKLVRLIIEVADTSISKDRSKAEIYREAGVEEYWIVNVGDKSVERYLFSQTNKAEFLPADSIASVSIGPREISIDLTRLFSEQ